MKFSHLVVFTIFFVSCQNRDVKLPINDNTGLHEVWDNSRVYVIFEEKNGDTLAQVKLGQIISTSHWLVAVDRRFKLKHVVSPLQIILKKRHKKTVHSKEGMHAYFTFLDSIQNKISFVDFDSIQIMPSYYTSKTYFKKYTKADDGFNRFHLQINSHQITLNDSIDLSQLNKKELYDSIQGYIVQQINEKNNRLYLNFDDNIFFDRFLNYYTFFKNSSFLKTTISKKIFIFNE